MESGAQGYPVFAQPLPCLLTIGSVNNKGHHTGLKFGLIREINGHAIDLTQISGQSVCKCSLMSANTVHTDARNKIDSLQQSCNARDIGCPGFQMIGKILRHLLKDGKASGSAVKQRITCVPA